MIVKTPAVRLAVELRNASIDGGRMRVEGVANMMPCSVELRPEELRAIAAVAIREIGLWRLLRWQFRKQPANTG